MFCLCLYCIWASLEEPSSWFSLSFCLGKQLSFILFMKLKVLCQLLQEEVCGPVCWHQVTEKCMRGDISEPPWDLLPHRRQAYAGVYCKAQTVLETFS